MVYEYLSPDVNIRQGDIFKTLPMVYLDPAALSILDEEEKVILLAGSWIDQSRTSIVQAVATIEPAHGIIVTQDCDAERDKLITFFRIGEFTEITGLTPSASNPDRWWADKFIERQRLHTKWLYLPADNQLGFPQRMAIDFRSVFQVRREFLVANVEQLRMGRLNAVAYEHYREKVAHYFRRYAYQEWYPLTKDEFQFYQDKNREEEIPPFEWQK